VPFPNDYRGPDAPRRSRRSSALRRRRSPPRASPRS
jgi:hypothetical protein